MKPNVRCPCTVRRVLAALACLVAFDPLRTIAADIEMPAAVDPRLTITLVAAEPDVVTPTGIAVDAAGRILVIESHTHFRPADYAGPPADRIRRLTDADGDGRAERVETYFEGTSSTMNLAVDSTGAVYVVTRNEIFRLRDTNNDGRADERTSIARLETDGNYPHNGLSGFAFDVAGNVYFGMGENLGAQYKLVGSDGSTHTGGGEGGNVFRCRADGGRLERVATGFWNPFHVCFDAFGRLFTVDNDPDSRPPCRLLHVVEGGDYGYRFRNGRKGVHPFTSWNGELPGTLPMVAGTGEAPSGVLAYESDLLPEDFRGTLLVTSWGDHRLERYRLEPHGASFRSRTEPIVRGGESFRPVGIAVAPDGSLVVSDWVDKSYELHGKGRVWRIAAKDRPKRKPTGMPREALAAIDRTTREEAARKLAAGGDSEREFLLATLKESQDPRVRATALGALATSGVAKDRLGLAREDSSVDVRAAAARWLPSDEPSQFASSLAEQPAEVRAEAMRRGGSGVNRAALVAALADADPFVRQAARWELQKSCDVDELLAELARAEGQVRLECVLLLRDASDPRARRLLPALLEDADPRIRFAAVQWVGEHRIAELRNQLADGLARGATTRELFEAYLAALEMLDGGQRKTGDELSGQAYIGQLLARDATPPAVRRRALRALAADHPLLTNDLLAGLVRQPDEALQLEAVRTLRERPDAPGRALLESMAKRDGTTISLRAEAMMALDPASPQQRTLLFHLAKCDEPALRAEALRSLRGVELTENEKLALGHSKFGNDAERALRERLIEPTRPPQWPKSEDASAWQKLLAGKADASVGERVFYHPRGPGCFRCHEMDGRGGRVGPSLSTVAQTMPRERLIESIVNPSREIAPQFVPWQVVKTDGTILTGVLVGESSTGERSYADAQGQVATLAPDQIESAAPLRQSIMPDNLAHSLTVQELRDLVAYLLKSR